MSAMNTAVATAHVHVSRLQRENEKLAARLRSIEREVNFLREMIEAAQALQSRTYESYLCTRTENTNLLAEIGLLESKLITKERDPWEPIDAEFTVEGNNGPGQVVS